MATGEAWFKVPSALRFNLTGKPGEFVSGKDVILHIIGMNGNAKDVTVASIEKQMIANTNIENMTRCNNLRLREFIGLNYEDYDSYMMNNFSV